MRSNTLSPLLKLLTVLLTGGMLLAAATPAEARHDRRDFREVRHDHRGGPPGRAIGHRGPPRHAAARRAAPPRTVVHKHHYYHPAPRYAPKRRYAPPPRRHHRHRSYDPAVVVNVPPIVFPLR